MAISHVCNFCRVFVALVIKLLYLGAWYFRPVMVMWSDGRVCGAAKWKTSGWECRGGNEGVVQGIVDGWKVYLHYIHTHNTISAATYNTFIHLHRSSGR